MTQPEGNTRTTAVLLQCYLNMLGFQVNNDMFKDHSFFFRNALVVSNYASLMEGITPDYEPLIHFFENLLMGGMYSLSNKELLVEKCFEQQE